MNRLAQLLSALATRPDDTLAFEGVVVPRQTVIPNPRVVVPEHLRLRAPSRIESV